MSSSRGGVCTRSNRYNKRTEQNLSALRPVKWQRAIIDQRRRSIGSDAKQSLRQSQSELSDNKETRTEL